MVLLQGREGPRIHFEGLAHLGLSDELLGTFGDEIQDFLKLSGSDPGFIDIGAVCSFVIFSTHSVSSFHKAKGPEGFSLSNPLFLFVIVLLSAVPHYKETPS